MFGRRVRMAFSIALALAGLLVVAMLPVAAQSVPAERATRTPRPTPTATPGCVISATHRASPDLLLVGEATTATVHIGAVCTFEASRMHVMLVLDGTSPVDRSIWRRAVQGMEQLVQALHFSENPTTALGVVAAANGRQTCPFTHDEATALACLRRFEGLREREPDSRNRQSVDRAFTDGLVQLRRQRVGTTPSNIREVLILLSPGPADAGCSRLLRSAGQAKLEKVLVVTVCLIADCEAACLRQVASSPRYFYQSDDFGSLLRIFQRALDDVIRFVYGRLDLHYIPAADVRYIPDSANPAPTQFDEATQRLDWRVNYFGRDGYTVTLRLAPTHPGRQPLGGGVGGALTDLSGRVWPVTVPQAEVDVLR